MNYFNRAYEIMNRKFLDWLEGFLELLPNLVLALLVFLGFIFFARVIKKLTLSLFQRFSGNLAINRFLSQIISVIVVIYGLIVFLDIINLDRTITSLLAGAGILGLAFSLAFQDTVANFVSSIMIAARKPYVMGDIIETQGYFGTVEKINMRSTIIYVPEGQLITIPNKVVFENAIRNYTIKGKRRIDLEVNVSYAEDLEFVKKITVEAIAKIDYLLTDTQIDFFYKEFSSSSIKLVVRYWIRFARQNDYLTAVSDGIMNIHSAYRENGITIPFPIRTVDFGIKGGTPLRKELKKITFLKPPQKEE